MPLRWGCLQAGVRMSVSGVWGSRASAACSGMSWGWPNSSVGSSLWLEPLPVQIQYSSLPNYEEREEDFNAEAVLLRRRFTEDGMACGALLLRLCTSRNLLAAISSGKYQSAVGDCSQLSGPQALHNQAGHASAQASNLPSSLQCYLESP